MYILGLAESHDASICLLQDDEIRFALALERPMRIKRAAIDRRVPTAECTIGAAWAEAIRSCLATEAIRFDDIDYVVATSPDVDECDAPKLVHAILPHLDTSKIV